MERNSCCWFPFYLRQYFDQIYTLHCIDYSATLECNKGAMKWMISLIGTPHLCTWADYFHDVHSNYDDEGPATFHEFGSYIVIIQWRMVDRIPYSLKYQTAKNASSSYIDASSCPTIVPLSTEIIASFSNSSDKIVATNWGLISMSVLVPLLCLIVP